MEQRFSDELVGKLQPVIDLGNDDVFPKMREGAQNTVELAKEIGSASLEKTATALDESAGIMIKNFTELFECLEKLMEYYKRLEQALN